MRNFLDTHGRTYPISITFTTLRRVRDTLGFDLSKLLDGRDETAKATDPVFFIDLLYIIVKPHADAFKLTDEQFGESLDAETAEQAADALAEALIDFFPPARRDLYRRAKKAGETMRQTIISRALEALTQTENNSTSSSASTDLPASSASPPATSTT